MNLRFTASKILHRATLLLALAAQAGHAATPEADSLAGLLRTETQDTSRVLLLKQLSFALRNSRPDQALQYAQRGIVLARQVGFRRGEGACLNNAGLAYWQVGNLPQALAMFLAALKVNEAIGYRKGQATNLGNIGSIYAEQGEQVAAINYTLRAKRIQESIGDELGVSLQLVNLGDSYEQLNRLADAERYTRLAYAKARKLDDAENLSIALTNLGNIAGKQQRPALALQYYREALSYLLRSGYDEGRCEVYLHMARLLEAQGHADSARHYARQALATARGGSFAKRVMQAGALLTALFKKQGRLDSAFVYQELTGAAKDSLYSHEKVKAVQSLFFTENMRQHQLEAAEEAAHEERVHTLQMVGIAVFILTFGLFLALFSRRAARPRTVEFMGVTALLMVFEFITMLIHPTIERLTHHNPVLVLLCLMGVASVLVPLHHKMEHLVKHHLLARHQQPAEQPAEVAA